MLTATAGSLSAEPLPISDFKLKRGYFGARLGFVANHDVLLNGRRIDSDPGFTFGAMVDVRIGDKYFYGFAFDIHRHYFSDTAQYGLDVSLNIKRDIKNSGRTVFRPGVAIGYSNISQVFGIDQTHFLTYRIGADIIFFGSRKAAFMIDVGLYGSILGGNKDVDVDLGISPLVRMGLML